MDWTVIITAGVSAVSAVVVAYIGRATKKSNDASNTAIEEKVTKIEGRMDVIDARFMDVQDKFAVFDEKISRQNDKLGSIEQHMGRQNAQLDAIRKRLQDQESANLIQQDELRKVGLELEDNNLRTMRLDLLHAIETDPDNTIVIMELAQKYFVDMKGNCYMSGVFQEWASSHNVNITSLFNQG